MHHRLQELRSGDVSTPKLQPLERSRSWLRARLVIVAGSRFRPTPGMANQHRSAPYRLAFGAARIAGPEGRLQVANRG